MGHAASRCGEVEGPFAPRHHTDTCHIRFLVEKKDFVLFVSELKLVIRERESVGFASPAILESCTTSPKADDFSNLDYDVLSYKCESGGETLHFVYVRCDCPGRYAGLNINRLDSRGQAAIHVAVRKRDLDMLTLLLNLGADAEKVSKWGLTPLHIACETGDLCSTNVLLKAAANPNALECQKLKNISNQGRTPTIIAATHGHVECLSRLLEAGANIELTDTSGNTALHKAAVYGNVACVSALLSRGANPNVQNNVGATPLQLALLQTHSDVVKALLNSGCDVEESRSELPSVATVAAMTGEYEVLMKCINNGCDVDNKDKSGRTPLYYTFTGDLKRLHNFYPAINSQGITFDFQYAQLVGRKDTFAALVQQGANVEAILKDALVANTLTIKHFTLPQNIELFRVCICACGFGEITNSETESLFWKLVSRNSHLLIMVLLQAVPSVTSLIQPKLLEVKDWTGAHTDEAAQRYLENAGAEPVTSSWIIAHIKQPRPLQEWCRQSIRRCISRNVPRESTKLPLPPRLRDYLVMADVLVDKPHYKGALLVEDTRGQH